MFRVLVGCAAILLLAAVAAAQQPDLEVVLVPLAIPEPVAGAHGSIWASSFVIRNNSATDAYVYPLDTLIPCPVGTCAPAETVEAFHTVDATRSVSSPDRPTALLFVNRAHADDLSFTLRVQDLSRTNETWGTAIPVVREREFLNTITLVDVPVESRFRRTLRVYALDADAGAQVRIRVYRSAIEPFPGEADEFLGEKDFTLLPPTSGHEWHTPSYLEVHDLGTIASVSPGDRLTVEVRGLSAGMRLWAMASITHDDTQFITTILPR